MHITPEILLVFVFMASMIAAVVDTLAGGGGLITLPILLMLGLQPSVALGTNKFQACVGELNASIHFIKHDSIGLKKLTFGAIFIAIGSIIGTILVYHVSPEVLNKTIPFLLLGVLFYTLFASKFIKEQAKPRLSFVSFYSIFGLLIGFYGGFLGPGTGSFWIVALMFFLGFELKQSVIYAKPLNFIGDFVSLICFMLIGSIDYKIAMIMAIGQLIGSFIGAKLVIYRGVKIIKPVFITIISVMIISVGYKNYIWTNRSVDLQAQNAKTSVTVNIPKNL